MKKNLQTSGLGELKNEPPKPAAVQVGYLRQSLAALALLVWSVLLNLGKFTEIRVGTGTYIYSSTKIKFDKALHLRCRSCAGTSLSATVESITSKQISVVKIRQRSMRLLIFSFKPTWEPEFPTLAIKIFSNYS